MTSLLLVMPLLLYLLWQFCWNTYSNTTRRISATSRIESLQNLALDNLPSKHPKVDIENAKIEKGCDECSQINQLCYGMNGEWFAKKCPIFVWKLFDSQQNSILKDANKDWKQIGSKPQFNSAKATFWRGIHRIVGIDHDQGECNQ